MCIRKSSRICGKAVAQPHVDELKGMEIDLERMTNAVVVSCNYVGHASLSHNGR